MAKRPVVGGTIIDLAKLDFSAELDRRIAEKGPGAFVSIHEIQGILQEEFDEVKAAVHQNNADQVYKELMDIMVACMWGAASIKGGYIDW